MTMKKASFSASRLALVEKATHEPVIVGDFVRLASGSPLGLVVDARNGNGDVVWLNRARDRSTLPLICLRPCVVQ